MFTFNVISSVNHKNLSSEEFQSLLLSVYELAYQQGQKDEELRLSKTVNHNFKN